MSATPDLLAKAHGMLAGVAVGDALGMPTEFLTPETIADWYGGGVTGLTRADARHPHHRLPAGAVTDDTDHTLLLAQVLIEEGEVRPEAWAAKLLAWGRTPRVQENRFVGPSTLKALAALEAGAPLEEVPRGGTSSGACMRTAALAIAFPDRAALEEQVVASCAVSHFTRAAVSGAMAMAFALSAALEPDATVDSIAAAAKEGAVRGRGHGAWAWTAPIERRIDHALRWARGLPAEEALALLYEVMGVDMYGDQLVPGALALAAMADGDAGEAMLLAANLGGDSDTLASMAGSVCGAWRGVEAVPPAWLAQVEAVNGLDLRAVASELLALRERNRERAGDAL